MTGVGQLASTACRCSQLRDAYQALVDTLHCDALVLVDGGTDSLLRGHESGLGSPIEDITSLAAGTSISLDDVYLVCLAFGLDSHHDVAHAEVLAAIAEYSRHGGFLGAFSLLDEMPEAQEFRDAVRFTQESGHRPSIITASVDAARRGEFGYYGQIDPEAAPPPSTARTVARR